MECSNPLDAAWLSVITVSVAFQGTINLLLLHALINFVVGSILWYFVGYSLSFGKSQKGLIGSLDDAFFLGFSDKNCSAHAQSIPAILFASFEMMLAILTPFLLLSAWVEQISILGALIIYLLWPLFVYYPLTHWIRGNGWLQDLFGIIDQSGSLTVHASTGLSALVLTRILSKEIHKDQVQKQQQSDEQKQIQNVYLIVGGVLTCLGWYLINIGSLHKFSNAAILSLINSHLSACTSSMSWVTILYLTTKHLKITLVLQGIMAGLVGISACSGSIEVWASLICGFLIGLISSVILWLVQKWQLSWISSSSHDITYINGIPGIIGAVTAGLFTKSSTDLETASGAFYSNGAQLGVQLLGVVTTVAWSLLCTYLLTWLIRLTVGFNGFDVNKLFAPLESSNDSVPFRLSKERKYLHHKLFQAVVEDDLLALNTLIKKQVDFGIQDFDKRTPLHVACSHGHLSCVKFLLRQPGVNVHVRDRWRASPLYEAVYFGHDQVVQSLLRHGASWSEDGIGDLLCIAVEKNDGEELQRLVSLGVNVNAANSGGGTALHVAASLGSRAVVQYLIDHRADINAVDSLGNTPLNYSDMHEHRAVSHLLEGLGSRRLSHHYSMSEICEVVNTGNLQMLRHMVHNGATICYRDSNKRTPLESLSAHLMNDAARTGDTKALKRLIPWTSHVNVADFDGQTPLHTAAMSGRLNVIKLLLKEGADATLVASANDHKAVEMELQKFHGLSEQILTEDFSSTCYSTRSPSRARDLKSHNAQYSYSNRNSMCSSENSVHVDSHRRTRDQGVSNTPHSSREILNLAEVRAPSEPKNLSSSRTSLIQSRVISNLNAQAREIAGGQPDYV
ncbi:Ammonium transporter 1 [Acropora cervicornis]|uniref:Ammonium transporter 1 n=1 Tax=Acropora cervicornis TaxID=6130 RepID=A0AAD9Q9L2_ACRCE|nr:Ammonium transporter 1 [Acropora cervicornis]